jgi:hypothetical protein
MYSEGANSVCRLSSHWHVDTEPAFLHTSNFQSKSSPQCQAFGKTGTSNG